MKCSTAHKLISPYIDGGLPERDAKALQDHMKICLNCQAEFDELRGLSNLFVNADKFKAPYGFHTRVMANIRSGKINETSRIPFFVRLAEAVVVIVVIALGALSGNFMFKGAAPDMSRDVVASLSLDVFDSAPPDSPGGVYLAMTEVKSEK